ncbi:unnamed protein product [Parnassius apollo]|uniref:(apollo) hypothetical protein n=1 Tax=Parnassius apollo TaxID=110799 RepID=A0A8S3Y6R4_PARAO|nr:unnamed protein product [Parnassius apollo]
MTASYCFEPHGVYSRTTQADGVSTLDVGSAADPSDIRRYGQSNFGTISTQADSFQDHVHLIIVPLRL